MLLVKYRDQGPLVVAIQILLNRHGNRLDVDGIYGKKTKDAVWDFQRRQKSIPRSGRDGDVGPQTWPLLSHGSGLRVLDATDVCDPAVAQNLKDRKEYWKILSTDVKCRKDGVVYAIRKLIARAGRSKSIVLLRFWGHGASARFHLGSGRGYRKPLIDPVTKKPLINPKTKQPIRLPRSPFAQDVLSQTTFRQLRPHLAKLTPYFASFGSVEFHGCSVAKGAAGKSFVGQLARLWGVPVRASRVDTIAGGAVTVDDASGVNKARPDLRLEVEAYGNELVVVYPNGQTLKAWAKGQAVKKPRRVPARR